jgi:hypothetical protein
MSGLPPGVAAAVVIPDKKDEAIKLFNEKFRSIYQITRAADKAAANAAASAPEQIHSSYKESFEFNLVNMKPYGGDIQAALETNRGNLEMAVNAIVPEIERSDIYDELYKAMDKVINPGEYYGGKRKSRKNKRKSKKTKKSKRKSRKN